jgi:hypothetical protein
VQIDVRLDEVVLRALEKEPERRYQQAGEIKTRVETIASTPAEGIRHTPCTEADGTRRGREFFVFGFGKKDDGVGWYSTKNRFCETLAR